MIDVESVLLVSRVCGCQIVYETSMHSHSNQLLDFNPFIKYVNL